MSRLSCRFLVLHCAVWLIALTFANGRCRAEDEAIDQPYQATIRPLLERYCFDCHSDEAAEGDVDLSAFRTVADVRRQTPVWLKVRQMLDGAQMPPREAMQPTDQEREQIRAWVHNDLAIVARKQAGDPGPVILRRLTNAEYNFSIRDLTGVDSLDPTHEFPIDGAAGEGFTNVGTGQGMSPALVQKYLDAAKQVADHAVLLPDGLRFSAATTARDQTDELLAQIRSLYRRYTTEGGGTTVNLDGRPMTTNQGGRLPVEAYLTATLAERETLQQGGDAIRTVAEQRGLSAKYLRRLWNALNRNDAEPSPLLDDVRRRWRTAKVADAAALAERITQWQSLLWKFNAVGQIGREGGPTAWMEPVAVIGTSDEALVAELLEAESRRETSVPLPALSGKPREPGAEPPLEEDDNSARDRIAASLDEFRELFPPTLCYERIVPVDEVVTLTLFYREDERLQRLMLDETEKTELDQLWDELIFVSQEPLKKVVVFEQISEFATQDRPDLVVAFAPLQQPILDRAEAFRMQQMAAEPHHVDAVIELADRAWRRPLAEDERQRLRRTYEQLRVGEVPHDEAVRLLLARVLTAPAFLFKLEQPGSGEQPVPVTPLELATRLSYFLCSSLPDDELRRVAESGLLTDDDVLVAQTRRLLSGPRTRRLAVHFACQWLHLRDFDQQDDKNAQLYPEFASLRTPMYEETVRFFEDLFRNDGSILDVLDANHTFLNRTLADHYGIDGISEDEWQRFGHVQAQGRGGILGMATVLASQSGASRTSPILRGNWVSETLLGERLPKPPPGIPQLPDTVPDNLTARQLIEQHSAAPECMKCHERIDPYGFSLEQFDTIGRLRARNVDTKTTLFDGTEIEGLSGLRDYLVNARRDDFVRQFCRKLLGYALGREVQLSDEPLLDEMLAKLKDNDFRFGVAVEAIVTSPQFRNIRGEQFE